MHHSNKAGFRRVVKTSMHLCGFDPSVTRATLGDEGKRAPSVHLHMRCPAARPETYAQPTTPTPGRNF